MDNKYYDAPVVDYKKLMIYFHSNCDERNYYDIPIVDINRFVELMFVSLASNSRYINLLDSSDKKAFLPMNFKENIENIMYSNDLGIKFSKFIDINHYYSDRLKWEEDLSIAIRNYLEEHKKECNINWETDSFEIPISLDEIDKVKKYYTIDELRLMKQFTSLLSSSMLTRSKKLEKIR